jgi:TPR repeat protein
VDAAEAVKFFRLAADQGHSDAQYNLGVCYLNGRGVAVDQAEAVRLWQLAADSGNESAARALLILTQGAPGTVIITEDDNEEEEEDEQEEGEEIDLVALRLKAGAGDSNARVLLGQCYEHGWAGVEINMVEASKLYLMAAMQGNPRAQLVLAMSYAGNTSTERDAAQMIRWYRMAADQGLAEAQSNLGEHYHYGIDVPVDVAEAARLYRAAAAQDFGYAQLNLAVCLRKGQGVAVDLAEARRLADTAVAAGFDVVDIDRGEMVITFANGQGNSLHNAEHLIDWCRMYADRGNAEAQCVLGHCFRAGHGVPPDAAEAVRLYTLAADQGDGIGRLSLATCLAEGAGVPAADKAAAQRLYALATADGWELTGLEQMEGSDHRFKASFANEAEHMFESREEATRFCRLAADNGNTAAKQALAESLAQAEE